MLLRAAEQLSCVHTASQEKWVLTSFPLASTSQASREKAETGEGARGFWECLKIVPEPGTRFLYLKEAILGNPQSVLCCTVVFVNALITTCCMKIPNSGM